MSDPRVVLQRRARGARVSKRLLSQTCVCWGAELGGARGFKSGDVGTHAQAGAASGSPRFCPETSVRGCVLDSGLDSVTEAKLVLGVGWGGPLGALPGFRELRPHRHLSPAFPQGWGLGQSLGPDRSMVPVSVSWPRLALGLFSPRPPVSTSPGLDFAAPGARRALESECPPAARSFEKQQELHCPHVTGSKEAVPSFLAWRGRAVLGAVLVCPGP